MDSAALKPLDVSITNLIEREATSLARGANWHLPPALTVDDLVSEGILAALQATKDWDGRGSKISYALARARWAMIDLLRKADNRPRAQARVTVRFVDIDLDSISTLPDQFACLSLSELDRALRKVKGKGGVVLRLSVLGFRPRQIAEIMGTDVKKVYSLRSSGIRSLRRLLT